MSYGISEALQVAIFDKIRSDAAVTTQSGGAIYDAMPAGTVPDIYVTLGGEEVRDKSDVSGHGAEHDVVLSVVTTTSGFRRGKALAAALSDALNDADLTLTRGACIGIQFLKARAFREGTGDQRRIDLTFRARVAA